VLKLQRRLHHIVEAPVADDRASRGFKLFITSLILLSVVSVILETVASLHASFGECFVAFEVASVAVFTAEYLVRVWVCTVDRRYSSSIWGRIKFMLSPMALVDLAAILPFYVASAIDLRFMRALRLLRLMRVLKIGRYSESLDLLADVVRHKRDDLLAATSIGMILLVVCSSLMYFVESSAQPRAFSSIPAAMWWGITTLTTVGYGDVYPVTIPGKVLAGLTALLGVGLFALPAGIFGSAFIAELQKRHLPQEGKCPHCGKELSPR
jgi:voltage-gated potassium channel